VYREMRTDAKAASDVVGATHSASSLNTTADAYRVGASHSSTARVGRAWFPW
jgi:hypothetical protein